MNTIQKTAALARSRYAAALTAFEAEMATVEEPATTDFDSPEWRRFEAREEAALMRHDVLRLQTEKVQAEDALIDWHLEQVCAAAPQRETEMRETYAAARRRLNYRERIVDLALRTAG